MANEKHDPWALLREARDFMREVANTRGPCPDCTECDRRDAIIATADAALAAHEAEERVDSATPVVEWRADGFGLDYHRQGNMLLMVVQTLDGNWGWETRVEGYAATEAEAKAAAIKAARGIE